MKPWQIVKVNTGRGKPWRAFEAGCIQKDQCWCRSFGTWAEAMAYVSGYEHD